jgi:hypothetical protein
MNDDLEGCSLADVLVKLEKGKIGHRAAMEWLNIDSINELVEIMHVNGRLMPGHQPMRVSPETQALIRAISRPLPEGDRPQRGGILETPRRSPMVGGEIDLSRPFEPGRKIDL